MQGRMFLLMFEATWSSAILVQDLGYTHDVLGYGRFGKRELLYMFLDLLINEHIL